MKQNEIDEMKYNGGTALGCEIDEGNAWMNKKMKYNACMEWNE